MAVVDIDFYAYIFSFLFFLSKCIQLKIVYHIVEWKILIGKEITKNYLTNKKVANKQR